jgi:hypothetical protein
MNKHDQEYYFVRSPIDREDLPSLTPDENTEDRQFRFKSQPLGSAPLVFYNGAGDYQKKLGVKVVKVPPKILFDGANPVVDGAIREKLLSYDIPNMFLHPAVYIHDDGKWYENYWYMTFTEQFDCWDRKNSTYDPDPMTLGGISYEIYTYSLNQTLLDGISIQDRLLFKMGGTTDGRVVCHQKLLRLFPGNGDSGAWIQPITEY